jgi:uncharacterized membrane protein
MEAGLIIVAMKTNPTKIYDINHELMLFLAIINVAAIIVTAVVTMIYGVNYSNELGYYGYIFVPFGLLRIINILQGVYYLYDRQKQANRQHLGHQQKNIG